MIIECTLNGLFQDVVTIIITSQMAVRQLDDDDDDWPLVVQNVIFEPLTSTNVLSHKTVSSQNDDKNDDNADKKW